MSSKKKPKNLGELLDKAKTEAAPRPRKASPVAQPPLTVRSISLTPAANATLDGLLAYASQQTGRKISASAVVRALLRLAEQQDLTSRIASLVEAEINTGDVIWGKVKNR